MSKEIAIEVKNLSKHFRLPIEQASGIKQAVINRFKGVKGYKEQKVLRNISFNVEKGDFFGIVGRNGSGKSTLLKLISGIYEPDGGEVKINGSLVSFIELGVGFNPQLTGRENVYLNGALMGFSVKEIDAMYDEIVDFAELHDFMDQKLKNYSSGMQVRLAFSCAIRAKSDILVLDEVLAVGDEAFQRKCNDYFEKIRKDTSQTIILVTHSMENVRKYCNRAMMIKNGKISVNGTPDDAANKYTLENFDETKTVAKENDSEDKKESVVKNFKVELLSGKQISQDDKVKIKVTYQLKKDIRTNVLVSLTELDRNLPLSGGRTKTELRKAGETITHNGVFDLSKINDCSIKVIGEIWDDKGEIIHYLTDREMPKFMIRRTDYPENPAKWPVLFERGKWNE